LAALEVIQFGMFAIRRIEGEQERKMRKGNGIGRGFGGR
jgi:hypothetical protein